MMQQLLPLSVADTEPPPPILIDELIWEILSLLPVKSLVRFRCVCKSWKLTISNPQFMKLHLRRSSAKAAADFADSQVVVMTKRDHIAHSPLLSKFHIVHDETFTADEPWPVHALREPFNQPHVSICYAPSLFSSQNNDKLKGHCRLIGACNGLVSVINEGYNSAESATKLSCCNLNPATKLRSQVSPTLSLCYKQFHSLIHSVFRIFGFGYDPLNDTYKVVVVFYHRNHLEHCMQSVANVYNMGDGCWRRIQSFPDFTREHWGRGTAPDQNGVYLNGTINWVLRLNIAYDIISLDLGSEVCSRLSLPCFPPPGPKCVYDLPPILGVLKDSLCVLHNNNDKTFVIWKMNEFGAHESWTPLFNFDFKKEDLYRFDKFFFSENDEVLLMTLTKQVLYNHSDITFKFNDRVHNYIHDWNNIENYVESLVSPS
ncbi:F-box/kelch-repeat protein At3g23880-like [Lotus japonicus]|uniref:F-box/kelch-repeat protein At3g23880-like n=1 Tax=Lotus japonicus TaxID=34305 RepID=UPI00258BB85F|nr:F-box/kelch-repeat protein At3g23880-like [Lotus japonicus]